MKDMVTAIPVPKLPKVKLPNVAKVIPGMGSKDSVDSDDPDMPFNSLGTLGYGHTIRVAVYDGARGAKKLYSGVLMVDQAGVIEFRSIGSAKVGGHTVAEARSMIASVFRSAGRTASQPRVHLISIENTPLITVDGDVSAPVVMPLRRHSSLSRVIAQAGGRRPSSSARAVYVSHEGQRRFYTTEALANESVEPSAGDIVTLSPDL